MHIAHLCFLTEFVLTLLLLLLLSSTETLSLDDNEIDGSLPSELGLLSRLETLSLSDNFLVGSLPAEMGQMHDLISMNLSNNRLSGGFPSIFRLLFDLKQLDLGQNRFTGTLDGFRLPQLVWSMDLGDNMFRGPIPDAYADLTQLTALTISNNPGVNETIPSNLDVNLLFIDGTAITGAAPATLCTDTGDLVQMSANQLSPRCNCCVVV